MSLIQNERTKLLASALNTTGIAVLVTGVIAPTVAAVYGTGPAGHTAWWGLIAVVWFLAGITLHLGGQYVLGRLKP